MKVTQCTRFMLGVQDLLAKAIVGVAELCCLGSLTFEGSYGCITASRVSAVGATLRRSMLEKHKTKKESAINVVAAAQQIGSLCKFVVSKYLDWAIYS